MDNVLFKRLYIRSAASNAPSVYAQLAGPASARPRFGLAIRDLSSPAERPGRDLNIAA